MTTHKKNTPLRKRSHQVMPLIERVAERSKSLVSAQTKTRMGTGARDLLAAVEETVQGYGASTKVRGGRCIPLFNSCISLFFCNHFGNIASWFGVSCLLFVGLAVLLSLVFISGSRPPLEK